MRCSIRCVIGLLLCGTAHAQDGTLTPKSLQAVLETKLSGPEGDRVAERIRTYFGGSGALAKCNTLSLPHTALSSVP